MSKDESIEKKLQALKNKRGEETSIEQYVSGILSGDVHLLSKAITLVESNKKEHQEIAEEVIEKCLPHSGSSIRIGVTGVPGVGKSTFIEALGNHIIDNDKRKLAVLAIDPSSLANKGSILGDKTRMETLAAKDHVFIRPSPTKGTLGGVAQKTRESIILCEAAGFDTIFVETVGVGQSETAVHSMVDFFLLLMLAGAGDELQGIKRGIMELADTLIINKADGDNIDNVQRAVQQYQNALHLFPHQKNWETKVLSCSAVTKEGVDIAWNTITEYFEKTDLEITRTEQSKFWLHEAIQQTLKDDFYSKPGIQVKLKEIEGKVIQKEISPFKAAKVLLNS